MKKEIRKAINKLAVEITEYDICDIESFETPEEAIDSHITWLENYSTEIIQTFESETRKYRG